MKSSIITSTLVAAALAASGIAQAGTVGITGVYAGSYTNTFGAAWGSLGDAICTSTPSCDWSLNFTAGTFTASGPIATTAGPSYAFLSPTTLTDIGGGEYLMNYTMQFGTNSASNQQTTLDITDIGGGVLSIITVDTEGDGVLGTMHNPVLGAPFQMNITSTVSAVPVPAAVWLFGSGLMGLVGVARRRKARA